MNDADAAPPVPPRESYGRLFLRFLRFGLLAWGGPVAQIAMIQRELVDEERWMSRERFRRTLAVYQVLPGPEATELCVHFGMLARGRLGAALAGLGFVLPGFALMLALSWWYFRFGLASPLVAAAFAGAQVAVVALIVRAAHRIGDHALHDRWLVAIAVAVFAASWLDAPFAITLLGAGLVYALARRGQGWAAVALGGALLAAGLPLAPPDAAPAMDAAAFGSASAPGVAALLVSGLRAGLLTFGGAYTAIPFLRQDAVEVGGWLSAQQFLDSLALSGILPAPLIIFATFVGYAGGGPIGALAMTVGIFLPAFAFTLLGYGLLERLIENRAIHAFLDGVTAGVVGLIAATAVELLRQGVRSPQAALIFALALALAYRWKAKAAVVAIVAGAALLGLLFFR